MRSTLPAGKDVVAFQCRNPIHRAHYELFIRAKDAPNVGEGAVVLVHPTMGPTQEDDISGLIRYRTYEVLKEETANPFVRWAYLPYSMHMAGPREAIQHMIIRKNYGCTHFIIGRDMAGCKVPLSLPLPSSSSHLVPRNAIPMLRPLAVCASRLHCRKYPCGTARVRHRRLPRLARHRPAVLPDGR